MSSHSPLSAGIHVRYAITQGIDLIGTPAGLVMDNRPMTVEGQDELGRIAGLAMAVLEVIGFVVLGAFAGYAVYRGDAFLAVPFGIGSLTFAISVWRRWRTSRA